MWRKLLIVCFFGALCSSQAFAGVSDPGDGESIQPAASSLALRRMALVIGNGDYAKTPLANPANDARAMSNALRMLGFEVMHHENLDEQRMKEAVRDFSRRLEAGGVGLFYFSGHGFQVADRTLLAPIDADQGSPSALITKGVDLKTVLADMSAARPGKTNLVILDTCLNNPFQAGHVAFPFPPAQTLIAYAAAAGGFAADVSRHGLFTAALLEAIAVPGLGLMDAFRRAGGAVRRASGQQQAPWVASSLAGDFRFAPPGAQSLALPIPIAPSEFVALTLRSRAILPKDSAEQYELAFWESIKDSNHASDYEAYLQAYPKGRFAALARARIERLRAAAKTETPKEEGRPAPAAKTPPERPRPAPAAKAAPEPAGKAAAERPRPAPTTKAVPEQAPPIPPKPSAAARASGGGGEIKDCPACPVMIALSPVAFSMGSNTGDPTEKPAHSVSLTAPFAIGKYEVTVEQWNACVAADACPRISSEGDRPANSPVRDVSWDDAQLYVKWLSKQSGKTYRLPTEAEWEFAARGGTSTRFWWGEQMRPGNANCKECGEPWSPDGPVNVGAFAANPFGLHDMNGSVWEWVSDCWHTSFKGAPADGRSWDVPNCRDRVIRGGSWREGASYMPSSTRFKYAASVRHSQNGFRVVRELN